MIERVEVSAPCYMEIGAAWSRRRMVLLGQEHGPRSISIALDERVTVQLERLAGENTVEVVVNHAGVEVSSWSGKIEEFDYTTPEAEMLAILAGYSLSGVRLTADFPFDPQMGLNANTVACVALAKACSQFMNGRGSNTHACQFAYDILAGSGDDPGWGLMGAIAGGINLWRWAYPEVRSRQARILDDPEIGEFESHLAVCIPDRTPGSGRPVTDDFLIPAKRQSYLDILGHLDGMREAMRTGDWASTLAPMRAEQQAEKVIDPDIGSDIAPYMGVVAGKQGEAIMEKLGAIFYFSPEPTEIPEVKLAWEAAGGNVLYTGIASRGID